MFIVMTSQSKIKYMQKENVMFSILIRCKECSILFMASFVGYPSILYLFTIYICLFKTIALVEKLIMSYWLVIQESLLGGHTAGVCPKTCCNWRLTKTNKKTGAL